MTRHQFPLLALCVCCLLPLRAQSIFCGFGNCYDVLNVQQSASSQDIKKSYEELHAQWNPDKDRSPGAEHRFDEIENAFAVLSDVEQHEAYEYYLMHPDETFYNTYSFYRHRYLPKMHLGYLTSAFVFIVSFLQYLIMQHGYRHTIRSLRQDKMLIKRAVQLIRASKERESFQQSAARQTVSVATGRSAKSRRSKKKHSSNRPSQAEIEEAIDQVLATGTVAIYGRYGFRFTLAGHILAWILWVLLPIYTTLSPYRCMRTLCFQIYSLVKYGILRHEYDRYAQEMLTRAALDISDEEWESFELAHRDELVVQKLWYPELLRAHITAHAKKMQHGPRKNWKGQTPRFVHHDEREYRYDIDIRLKADEPDEPDEDDDEPEVKNLSVKAEEQKSEEPIS